MDNLISIYITTCNRAAKLPRAVRSAMEQSYKNIEILICDDASTDNTEEVIQELMKEDRRIKYFKNEQNMGACYSRNVCINNACGKYITGLDDDDAFTTERLKVFLNYWEDQYSFISANFYEVSGNISTIRYERSTDKIHSYKELLFDNIASNQIFTETHKLRSINGFDTRVKRLQDWDTWLRLAYNKGNFLSLKDSTYIMYHDHHSMESRVSQNSSFTTALTELGKRNKEIYGEKNHKILQYLIKYHANTLSLSEAVKWAFYQKNGHYLIKYLKNIFNW